VDASQVVAHVADFVADVVVISSVVSVVRAKLEGCLFTNLAFVISPPARQGIVVQHCARVLITTREALGSEVVAATVGAEVDGSQVVAHLADFVADSVGVTLSELAFPVVSPALDGGVAQHCTRVFITTQNALGGEAGAEVDGNQGVAHLAGAVADSSGVALSELAFAIITPALDGVVAQQRARVDITTREALGSEVGAVNCAKVHGDEGVAQLGIKIICILVVITIKI
jgi:hypothetical protein